MKCRSENLTSKIETGSVLPPWSRHLGLVSEISFTRLMVFVRGNGGELTRVGLPEDLQMQDQDPVVYDGRRSRPLPGRKRRPRSWRGSPCYGRQTLPVLGGFLDAESRSEPAAGLGPGFRNLLHEVGV